MPEDVLFADERRLDRADIADYLRSVADRLDNGEPVSFTAGERSVTVEPPARPTFEVKVERETASGAEVGELSVELELEWDEDGGDGPAEQGSLEIS